MEYFALSDQVEREELMKRAPVEAFESLAALMKLCDDELNNWLGGAEGYANEFSEEYIAASILREMAEIYHICRRDGWNEDKTKASP
jgi:hypothetical protein